MLHSQQIQVMQRRQQVKQQRQQQQHQCQRLQDLRRLWQNLQHHHQDELQKLADEHQEELQQREYYEDRITDLDTKYEIYRHDLDSNHHNHNHHKFNGYETEHNDWHETTTRVWDELDRHQHDKEELEEKVMI